MKRALVFAPTPSGGLAEHVFYQARALDKLGLAVTCLTTRSFLAGREGSFEIRRKLFEMPASELPKWIRRPRQIFSLLANQGLLAWWILRLRPDFVLLETYSEYLAPFWIWPHWFLARVMGVRYAANLHDPVRKGLIGPAWWHEWSFALAYRPLRVALVHGRVKPEARVPAWVRTEEVPVGLYDIRHSKVSRASVRQSWGAQEGQKVFLSFGYVRDGKNLDLAVRALRDVAGSFLVIAGSVAAASDRPFAFYRRLAIELGVVDRCFLREGFVPDDELGAMFQAADFVLLSYSSTFHSQSGVLNIAARARKSVLASSAPGPLVEAVQRFNLGVVVEPDSGPAIVRGMQELMTSDLRPGWAEYEEYAGWEVNVRKLLEALRESAGGPRPGGATADTNGKPSEITTSVKGI
jgi:glycosyltransferase involved in cell wall biosynthesis